MFNVSMQLEEFFFLSPRKGMRLVAWNFFLSFRHIKRLSVCCFIVYLLDFSSLSMVFSCHEVVFEKDAHVGFKLVWIRHITE